ncbi:MAG TPA: ABC transporter permease [Jatrophihabitantaceae bacterium]|jgi:NitT/TauT family transport system permease protein|nr:ABC transporter permease [Jatrophihabitantaceae bacterium]
MSTDLDAPSTALTVGVAQRRMRLSGRMRRRLLINASRLTLLVVLLGGWELGVNEKWIDPFFWGQPSGAYKQLKTWITQGTAQGPLGEQISVTLQEAAYGFVIGVALGVVCGIALGRNQFLAELFAPFIKVANSIPRIILGSIFTVAFGFGIKSKIILAVVLVFFGVFFNAFQGTREVDRNLLNNARILGASRWQVTRHVVLPSAFTWIIASLHVSFGFALIGALVGELLGADKGLGLLIRNSQNNLNMNGVLAGMVLVAIIALTAEALITLLEKRVLRWRPPQQGELPID